MYFGGHFQTVEDATQLINFPLNGSGFGVHSKDSLPGPVSPRCLHILFQVFPVSFVFTFVMHFK